jgi:hypothetical protein
VRDGGEGGRGGGGKGEGRMQVRRGTAIRCAPARPSATPHQRGGHACQPSHKSTHTLPPARCPLQLGRCMTAAAHQAAAGACSPMPRGGARMSAGRRLHRQTGPGGQASRSLGHAAAARGRGTSQLRSRCDGPRGVRTAWHVWHGTARPMYAAVLRRRPPPPPPQRHVRANCSQQKPAPHARGAPHCRELAAPMPRMRMPLTREAGRSAECHWPCDQF